MQQVKSSIRASRNFGKLCGLGLNLPSIPLPNTGISSIGGNANDWARALLMSNQKDLGIVLDQDRTLGWANVEAAKLPRYQRCKVSLTEFFAQPEQCLSKVNSDKYYIVAMPRDMRLPRRTCPGVDANGVIDFLKKTIPPEAVAQYDLTILQYFENLYGGNITTGPNGHVLVEFKSGLQTGMDSGRASVEFLAVRHPYLRSFKYSFKDQELRQAVYDLVMRLPHTGNGPDNKFTPGYFEFALVQKKPGELLSPIFFDCQYGAVYQLPWEAWEVKSGLEATRKRSHKKRR